VPPVARCSRPNSLAQEHCRRCLRLCRRPCFRCMRWTRQCRCCCDPTVPSRSAGIRAAPCWSVRRAAWPPRSWPRCCGPCDHRHRYPSCSGRPVGRGLKYADGLSNLVTQLVGAGVVTECRQPRGRAASIRIHGRGPLSELLVEALRCSGARIAHSSQPHAAVSSAAVDLVVLTDYLVADPRMVRDLDNDHHHHQPPTRRPATRRNSNWSASNRRAS
jgi:hypothetical protein